MYNNLKEYSFLYSRCIVGAALSAAGNIFSSAIGAASGAIQAKKEREFNAEQAQLNRDFQREERELTQEFNLDMWNRNNEYNSLSSQVERAKEAGISPNALFGSSTIAANPVTSSPMSGSVASATSSAVDVVGNNVANMGNSALSALESLARKRNLESLTQLNAQEHAWNEATFDTRVNEAEGRVKLITSELKTNIEERRKLRSDVKVNDSIIDKNEASAALDIVNEETVRAGLPYVCHLKQAELDNAIETGNQIRASIVEMKRNGIYQRALADSQTRLNKANEDIAVAEARSATANAEVNESTKDEQIAIKEYESNMLRLKNDLATALNCPLDAPEFVFFWQLNEQGLLENYITDVMNSVAYNKGASEARGEKNYDVMLDILSILTMFFSKCKVNPRTIKM